MRKLFLFALLAIPAFPAACTLTNNAGSACASKTCTAAAIIADTTHANWTGTGCTANGYYPGAVGTATVASPPGSPSTGQTWLFTDASAVGTCSGGGNSKVMCQWSGSAWTLNADTVNIPNGYALTGPASYWTIGGSPANNAATPAIMLNTSGSVTMPASSTLRARGDALFTPVSYGSGLQPDGLIMSAGSTYIFDSSQASAPTSTRYRYGPQGGSYGYRAFVANGTSASHVAVTSDNTNSALNGQFRVNNVGGGAVDYGGTLRATYTDFSSIGDAASTGQSFEVADCQYSGCVMSFSVTHGTFNNVGPNVQQSIGYNSTFNLAYDIFTNSPGVTNFSIGSSNAPTGGVSSVTHTVFDQAWNNGGSCSSVLEPGWTFADDYFANGWCQISTTTAMADIFYRMLSSTSTWGLSGGNISGGYFLLDATTSAETHMITPATTNSFAFSGFIEDTPDDVTAQPGFALLPPNSGAGTAGYSNNIVIPTKGGNASVSMNGCTNALPGAGSPVQNINHNTVILGLTADYTANAITVDEGGACLVAYNQFESNMMWAKSGAFYKVSSWGSPTGPFLTNPLTTVADNAVDSSAHITATNAACSGCSNQANGYAAKWSATPGGSDIVAAPYFADATRNVETFDTAYLGNSAGAQWLTGTAYTVGQVVSDPKSTVYNNATVNYRCIAAHTSGASTEPNVGASWRTDWEFASLNDIRTATAAGTTYADWAIGCASACTAIQALEGWVKRGFTPQNPALWCAGADGEAVGAVPFCANGKVMIGALAGI
jgi:hypothetical protein